MYTKEFQRYLNQMSDVFGDLGYKVKTLNEKQLNDLAMIFFDSGYSPAKVVMSVIRTELTRKGS